MRDMNLSNKVINYIKGRPNELVTVVEISKDLGLEPEQVRYAMRRVIEKTVLGRYVTVATRGNSWNVGAVPGGRGKKQEQAEPQPPAQAEARETITLEMVGRLADGTNVLRSDNGNLWKLVSL